MRTIGVFNTGSGPCRTAPDGAWRAAARRTAYALVGVSLVALSSGLAGAQTGQPVRAPQQTGTALDEITVTATRTEERAVDALAGVSVTTRQEIRARDPQRIGTVLSTTPGVTTQENPNDPATSVNVRGLQDFGRVAVTIDGARQNFQRSGHNANGAFYLDPAFVRVIDITRGPVANIYGSGAIGGVVSFETIGPRDILKPGERWGAEFNGSGLFGRQTGFSGSAIGAVKPSDWFAAMAGFSFRDLGNYRDGAGLLVPGSSSELRSGIGKIEITPAEGHRLTLGGQFQRYDFAGGAGTAFAPRRASDVTTSNLTARYSFSRPDLPWLNLNAGLYQTETDTRQVRLSGNAAQIGARRGFNIVTSGFDVNNTSRFDFGGPVLALTYGVDGFEDRVKTSDNEPNGASNRFTPSGKRLVYGGFVQGALKWGMFDVIGAARYDAYELSSATVSSRGERVSPKITLGVTPLAGLQFYGTYAEGYRAPAITETLVEGLHPPPATFRFLPNPSLRPEVGRTIEAGVNLKYDNVFLAGDRLRGKLSVFRNNVRDFIEGVALPQPLPFGSFQYQNIANARLTGVEGELLYDARRWFASLSGSSVRGSNRSNGQPLGSVYPDKLAVGAGLRFLDEKLTVSARLIMVAAQTRVPTGSPTSKAYALVDLQASYEFAPDARAFVSLENIGDVRYQRYRDGDRSPGFVGRIGFSTRFGG
jgi:hemoglobin/transferrin/lactoferrin receptor protein